MSASSTNWGGGAEEGKTNQKAKVKTKEVGPAPKKTHLLSENTDVMSERL
jgi:hypothetical protein